MLQVALGWELYERTHSALALGLVGLVTAIPAVLLALPAGHLADKMDRKKIVIGAQALFVVDVACRLRPSRICRVRFSLIFGILLIRGVGTGVQQSGALGVVAEARAGGSVRECGDVVEQRVSDCGSRRACDWWIGDRHCSIVRRRAYVIDACLTSIYLHDVVRNSRRRVGVQASARRSSRKRR